MAEIITTPIRKAIKKMAEISQLARALNLMPTPEDFALRLIGELKSIVAMMNRVSTRINDILERYSNIPGEFLLKGFDEVLDKLDDLNDYAKFAIKETSDVMSGVVDSGQSIVGAIGSAVSATTSAVLQVGGGLSYGTVAMGANIKLAMTGNGRRMMTNAVVQDVIDGNVSVSEINNEFENRRENEVGDIDNLADTIKDWTKTASSKSTESIDDFFGNAGSGIDNALEWIGETKDNADELVDNTVGVLTEKVETAKRKVEEQIEKVRNEFNKFTQTFDEAFGFINGKNFAEDVFRNASNTAYEKMDSEVFDAVGELTGDVADFIKNFNIGKVVTALGGLVVGAGAATLAMDLLPTIDVDRMLKDIIGGIDSYKEDKMTKLYYNKYFENEPDLLEVPDVPWLLSKDDLEKYNADGYNKYLEEFGEENNNIRSEILEKMQNVNSASDLSAVYKENKEKMKENKSALKAMRKVRRDAIKAKQIEKYKGFLKIELDYLKKECLNLKDSLKYEWDSMMAQYKDACQQISKFFTSDGSGGNAIIDRCCDRINQDATEIVELCQSITVELTSAVIAVPTPYAIGTCFDMPVHKIVSFLKDLKIIITFLKNLIRLGVDIISQITIIVKLICAGFQSLEEIMDTLKKLIGIDKILNMINFLIELFSPKVADAKILLENSLSPIYYNETDEYANIMDSLEQGLDGELAEGESITIKSIKYSDDPYARKKYKKDIEGSGITYVYKDGKLKGGGMDMEDIGDMLEEIEEKGEREISAYRSPILNEAGDDIAGWIFYYPYAYESMKSSWWAIKKRIRNKVIKRASRKNKLQNGKPTGGVAALKSNKSFGKTVNGEYQDRSKLAYDAYYWYTKWTNDPTDCDPDWSNTEMVTDENGNIVGAKAKEDNVVSPVQTTQNGSLVELSNGSRVFVEGSIVKSGDYVSVNGMKYRVK